MHERVAALLFHVSIWRGVRAAFLVRWCRILQLQMIIPLQAGQN
jgi:hypothetical protein